MKRIWLRYAVIVALIATGVGGAWLVKQKVTSVAAQPSASAAEASAEPPANSLRPITLAANAADSAGPPLTTAPDVNDAPPAPPDFAQSPTVGSAPHADVPVYGSGASPVSYGEPAYAAGSAAADPASNETGSNSSGDSLRVTVGDAPASAAAASSEATAVYGNLASNPAAPSAPRFDESPAAGSGMPLADGAASPIAASSPMTEPTVTDTAAPPAAAVADAPRYSLNDAVAGDAPAESSVPARFADASSGNATPLPSLSRMTGSQPPADATGVVPVGFASLSSGTPGGRNLEGLQTPVLSLEKIAPEEVQVGQVATFEIIVRNDGKVAAHQVVVTDRVPEGTQLVKASREFSQTPDGALAWQLGTLAPGDELRIALDLMPVVEGEIGSVAQVTFQAQASVSTRSTKPVLELRQSVARQVLIGETVVFDITLANTGTGDAAGVVIEEDVPAGLVHSAGSQLEYEVGLLRAGESRSMQLILQADGAGVVRNVIKVHAANGQEVVDEAQFEVIAPQLVTGVEGPRRRYLGREAQFAVQIANPGTAPARDVALSVHLPRGLKFVSADNKGKYDAASHAVYWSLVELPAQEQGAVNVVALPIEAGDWKLRVESRSALATAHAHEHPIVVESITELVFAVSDAQDPIEVGAETTYEIRVANNGNKPAKNVQVGALLPPALTPLTGDGPGRVVVEGQKVLAEPIAVLAPRQEVVFHIKVQGRQAGDHVIDVQLVSDDFTAPVIKQESTKVYADQ